MHDMIRAPSQARSRRTMDEVYRSLDTLLRERSFDRITIADLAEHAGVAVGSIYARFRDKNALLAGLYEGACDEALKCLGPLSSTVRWEKRRDEDMLRSIIVSVERFYRQQAHILNAAVFANVTQVDESRVGVWETALERFSGMLMERWPSAEPSQLRQGVRVIIRFTTAAMHQSVIIKPVNSWKGRISGKLLVSELVHYSLDVLERARAKVL